MRTLADLSCEGCGRAYFGDLPAGHGLYAPMLIEKETGEVYDRYDCEWHADWLRDAYAKRASEPIGLEITTYRAIQRPVVLLNCLDVLYGHCLLKLLNAQYYLDHRPDLDLVILAPRFMAWMIPEGVAEVWLVDRPLRRGTEWNDRLADAIRCRVESFGECWLSVAFNHPHPEDYDITRFTGVDPFPAAEWEARLERPTVSFIWREDRLWRHKPDASDPISTRLGRRVRRTMGVQRGPLEEQAHQVVALAQWLRARWPALDFALVGLGEPGGMPFWVTDMRTRQIDTAIEKQWCDRYARSHLVVGIHGSNMLLPSAHAGATVELVPSDRWGNTLQATLFEREDRRMIAFRYRYIPCETPADVLACLINSMLSGHHIVRRIMPKSACDHADFSDAAHTARAVAFFRESQNPYRCNGLPSPVRIEE